MSAQAPATADTAPLVSVLVPLYNHAPWVEAALDSVAAQDHPALELIVVDDASGDASAQRACRWLARPAVAGRFRRTVLEVRPRNAGAHAAINRAVRRARGEWLALLNSDDTYPPQRLSRLLAHAQAQQVPWAWSGVLPVAEAGHTSHPGLAELLAFASHSAPLWPSAGFGLLHDNLLLSTGNLLLRRSFWRTVGPMAPLRLAHDWDWALRACLQAEPAVLPEPLYHYRLHPNNSFAQWAGLADAEREACLRRYLQAVRHTAPPNPLAPSPQHWPGLFEAWVQRCGLAPLWQQVVAGRQGVRQW